LEVAGVTKRFRAVEVLRDVSLQVRAGEVVALVGETGAGKSSLVACIGRVLDLDGGDIRLAGDRMPSTPSQVRRAGVEILWQDPGICDDLDVAANVSLGREGRVLFAAGRRRAAVSVLERVGADGLSPDQLARTLSGGQKQLVALARAVIGEPRVLILDEPTASLGVVEARRVQALITEFRDRGAGVLLVTHDLEQVFALADRIVVLRHGRVVADVSPVEVQRADVVGLMSGIAMDTVAQRQLRRLHSLVEQLSDVEPAASLPLIVSAMAAALHQEMLCVHLLDASGDEPVLRRSAAVGLPAPMLGVNELLPIGPDGGCAGLAAATAEVTVVDDLSTHPLPGPYRLAAAASGVYSEWAAPVVGARGVLGTVSGYGRSVGRPDAERLELARLYLGYAAAAIERERLLAEVSRRNRVLEALRGMLETLAGPDRIEGGLAAALLALSRGLGAVGVAAMVEQQGTLAFHSANDAGGEPLEAGAGRLRAAALELLADVGDGRARLIAADLAAVTLRLPEGRAALVAHLPPGGSPASDTLELLDDASRSLALAMEADALESARREAAALRRSRAIQRELLSSLSHELRTPLTAIRGYASTLCQPDLSWDQESTERFLRSIEAESARLERLVGDLLDSTAIESGSLRLHPDWCDLRLVVEAAVSCVESRGTVRCLIPDDLEPIWADHDRLEQVLVNLLENACTHGRSAEGAEVVVTACPDHGTVEIAVRDEGPGVSKALSSRIFEPHVRGGVEIPGAGLGLSIASGIVDAHGGALTVRPDQRGATFVVRLPTEPPEIALDGVAPAWTLPSDTEAADAV
jgi:signal transduction histidine kinase/ABC-type multidrug transport system ATPase subunit